ncbi:MULTISPECIES: PepSY-associated TM helix domain-containing protein [unclassified Novosphingobium]|uniref:PepSY-associated TM helix domain-containing protein n=1 Tax=unclassified Novosphingobium TaxID=2644732 RepID=UPI00146D95D8|nr:MULTISPECIES: PepSY-associated TM helix domain-containing protein [unclassified Novosphingobium]NMN04228.1 putative iron-regulated membrane protein [Novosphingobium sp. SG919]NMN85780.1 putative iron-regulated membrane protein [Novosphingobium sp. SG916]
MALPGRPFWVIVHRWAGLTLALFLAVAGLTGSLLPWFSELDAAMAPAMQNAAPPQPGLAAMDPLVVRSAMLARHPSARVDFLYLTREPGRADRLYATWIDPQTGLERADRPDWDDVFINPWTGEEQGHRRNGAIEQGLVNLMPFLYRLHYSLALGPWGLFAMGLAALVWTVDCFVGFYLTLPPGALKAAGFWRRWRPSWKVRRPTTGYKLTFDLHRAGGLWLWPILLVFALSSVSFNLPQVYRPVMDLLGAQDAEALVEQAVLPTARWTPALDFSAAARRGADLAQQEAARRGLALPGDGRAWLWYVPTSGLYVYGVKSSADITRDGGGTRIVFDGQTGALRAVSLPTGANGADTFTTWIVALHMAQVGGLAWRIAVTVIGFATTILSVTGVLIWLRKRSARAGRKFKTARRPLPA